MSSSSQVVYTHAVSNNSWRMAIYTHEKGLKPEEKEINLLTGTHKSPEFLAINPRGQIPVWKDGDIIIVESLAIMMYLESKHHNNPLIPTKHEDNALFLSRYFQFLAKLDNHNMTGSVLGGKKREELKDRIDALLVELKFWDTALEGREYLANTFSLADIAVIPLITTFAESFGLDLAQFPHLNAWYKRVWARPSVKDTCTFAPIFASIPHDRVLEA